MARQRFSQDHWLCAQAIIRSIGSIILLVALILLLYCNYYYGVSLRLGYAFTATLLVLNTLVILRIFLHLRTIRLGGRPLNHNYGIHAETQCLGVLDTVMIILAVLAAVVLHEFNLLLLCDDDDDDDDCKPGESTPSLSLPIRDSVVWLFAAFVILLFVGIIIDCMQGRTLRNIGRSDNTPLVAVESNPRDQVGRQPTPPTVSGEAVSMPEPAHAVNPDPTITDGYMGSPELIAMRGTGNPVGARR